MAQEEKVSAPDQDEAKYQAFDVGPQGGIPQDKPKKRSTLLTVCPFILGEDSADAFSWLHPVYNSIPKEDTLLAYHACSCRWLTDVHLCTAICRSQSPRHNARWAIKRL